MYTMNIKDIDGGLTLDHANKHFLVKHLLYSVLGPQHTPNSNNTGVTGQPVIEEFGVYITPTQADAILLGKALKGETIGEVSITLWTINNGKAVMAQKFTLTECTIGKIGEGPNMDGPTRLLRFNMVQLKEESFKPDGTSSGWSSYNFKTAKAA